MKFQFSNKSAAKVDAQVLVFFVTEDFAFSKDLQEVADAYCPTLKQFLSLEKFTGKKDSIVTLPVAAGSSARLLVFAGLGKKDKITIEIYRRSVGTIIKMVQKKKKDSVALQLPDPKLFHSRQEYLAQQTTVIAEIATYHYDEYLSEDAKRKKDITVILLNSDQEAIEKGIKDGAIIGSAVNQARTWIDMPPSQLTPVALADKAEEIAKKYKLKCTVFSEDKIIKMGMGGLAGVSAGSENDCKLAILEYKTSKKNAPTIAFVGKGITFDSGGLSIKPAAGMENMKDDMSGAAAVISTMEAIAQLKPEVNILGVAALAENMPSGKATKPGDILRFYNGKTAEIRNTDAEGRLVLADALSYIAKEYKPEAMIDLATLTGLCHHFFGPFYSALLSNNKKLEEKVVKAGNCTGEKVWPLPHDEDYKQGIVSHIADIQNTGKESIRSGTITAGLFLEHFVNDIPWAHVDIAGTSFDTPMIPYFDHGATGVGVRLLVDLAQHWND